jgi:hypothetical protein
MRGESTVHTPPASRTTRRCAGPGIRPAGGASAGTRTAAPACSGEMTAGIANGVYQSGSNGSSRTAAS